MGLVSACFGGGAACECCLGFQHLLGFTLQLSGLSPQDPFAFPARDAGACLATTTTERVGMICLWFLTSWEGWGHAEYFCFWYFLDTI